MAQDQQYRAVKGMGDIFPEEARRWRALEDLALSVGRRFGYGEIRTPLVEATELFARSIGEGTDIVEKEMFTFPGSGEKSFSLRPEGTAGVVRACLEHNVFAQNQLARYVYLGPMFRRERPQAGRRRQFHQFGAEALGSRHPVLDAELIDLLLLFLEKSGLEGWRLAVNSVGCPRCRPDYRERLIAYLEQVEEQLCDNCRRRRETNPLRVLDCKNPACRKLAEAGPKPLDSLCLDCASHLGQVRELLTELEIPFSLDPMMVRGLDYYTSLVFEVTGPALGAQDAVAGGGRYDTLIGELGGPDLGAAGFSVGLERLLLGLTGKEIPPAGVSLGRLYLAAAGPEAFRPQFVLLSRLRRRGFAAVMDYSDRSLKAQMREANKLGVDRVLLRGPEELSSRTVKIKDMKSGKETPVPENEAINSLIRCGPPPHPDF
jgi:histidyl-tRNA synthetase